MAASSGKKTSSSKKSTNKRNGNNSTTGNRKRKQDVYQAQKDSELFHEIGLIVLFVVILSLPGGTAPLIRREYRDAVYRRNHMLTSN